MCDFPDCDAILPFLRCDACGGSFCDEHIAKFVHGCHRQRQPMLPPRQSAPFVPIQLGSSSLMPLGVMPMPMLIPPPMSMMAMQNVQDVSRTLLRTSIAPQIIEECSQEKVQRDDAPPVDVIVRLRYCRSSLPGSLGWLIAQAQGPGHEDQPPRRFEWLLGTDHFDALKVRIKWSGSDGLRLVAHGFDDGTICFVCGKHERARIIDLEAAMRDDRKASIAVSLSFGVKTLGLFHPLVAMMFCDDREEETVNPSQPILPCQTGMESSFTLDVADEDDGRPDTPDDEVEVTLNPDYEEMEELPCTLVALDGNNDACRLSIDFDLEAMHIQDRLHLMHVLIASDLSRLATGKGRNTLQRCEQNCQQFFHHCFPITRGARFLEDLVGRGLERQRTSACTFVLEIQEIIRPWITTANNWNEPCENRNTQPFQWKLARALGCITTSHPLASPVLYLRALKEHELIVAHPECKTLKAQIILQSGIGHCREFAEVSFCVLTTLADREPAIADLLGGIYRCEYEDQDHAFVAGGLDMREFEPSGNEFLGRWNVAIDLCTTRRRGWVCDPYLEALEARVTLWGKHVGYLQDLEQEEDDVASRVLDLDAVLSANAEKNSDKSALRLMRTAKPRPLFIRDRYDHVCLYVVVSVDWEGTNLHPVNLQQFERHRSEFPGVPLTHFVCPQYLCDAFVWPVQAEELTEEPKLGWFTDLEPDVATIKSWVVKSIGPSDEVGLHIHGWTKLVESSGVKSKWSMPEQPVGSRWGDYGHDDYLLAYSEEELGKIVVKGLEYLDLFAFPKPKCYRAGGWAARPELLRAVLAAGIQVDSSMLAASYVDAVSKSEPALHEALSQLWGAVPDLPPAQVIDLGEDICIYEIPDGCALADYVDANRMLDAAKEAIVRVQRGVSQIFGLGWHQESGSNSYFNLFIEEQVVGGQAVTRMWQELQKETGFYDRVHAVLKFLGTTNACRVKFVTVSEAAKLCLDWTGSKQ